jgi:tRNA A-37 threonylcarbamoyl transferase component Bud32
LYKVTYDLLSDELMKLGGLFISKYTFNKLFCLPMIITNRIYEIFCRDEKLLSPDLFTSGFCKLLSADKEAKCRFLFEIFDFENNGRIRKNDLLICIRFMNYCIKDKQVISPLGIKESFCLKDLSDEKYISELFDNISQQIFKGIGFSQESIEFFSLKFKPNSQVAQTQPDSEENCELSELAETSVSINIPFLKLNNKFVESLHHTMINKKMSELAGIPSKPRSRSDLNMKIVDMTSIKFDYEACVYKFKADGKLKKFWLVLIGKDIYYFKSEAKEGLKGLHNLSGSYVSEVSTLLHNDKEWFTFSLFIKKERKYFCKTKKEAITWENKLKVALGQKDIYTDYILLQELGEGAYGKVKLARNKSTGITCAIKCIDKSKLKEKEIQHVKNEIDILRSLSHTNIVSYIDDYESKDHVYIVMEYLEYNLMNYLQKNDFKLNENRIRYIFKQVGEAVKYLRDNAILHRDLKLNNIMLSENNNGVTVKIIDFGMSEIMGFNKKPETICGSIYYIAPEVIARERFTFSADIWSLGVVLYYALFNNYPYTGDTELDIGRMIVHTDVVFPCDIICSVKVMNLLRKCLEKEPSKRITIDDLLSDVWIDV